MMRGMAAGVSSICARTQGEGRGGGGTCGGAALRCGCATVRGMLCLGRGWADNDSACTNCAATLQCARVPLMHALRCQ